MRRCCGGMDGQNVILVLFSVGRTACQTETQHLNESSNTDCASDVDNVHAFRIWATGGPSLVLIPRCGNRV